MYHLPGVKCKNGFMYFVRDNLGFLVTTDEKIGYVFDVGRKYGNKDINN